MRNALPLATALVALLAWSLATSPAAAGGPTSERALVVGGQLRVVVTATCVVEPVVRVDIHSRVAGVAVRCCVDAGDSVKAGDTLIQLDATDMQIELDGAVARWRVGQVDVRAAEEALERARLDQEMRERRAQAAGVTSPAEVDESRLPGSAIARSTLACERARAELAVLESAAQAARRRLEATRIVSPIDGVVLAMSVRVGEIVEREAGPPVCAVADLSRVVGAALIPEADVARVRPGMPAVLRVPAYNDRSFKGHVERIEPLGRALPDGSARFRARVALDNLERRLLPGMFATAEIAVEQRECAALVPSAAIVRREGRPGIEVIVGGEAGAPRIEWRAVQVGASDGVQTEVVAGAVAGEAVLVRARR